MPPTLRHTFSTLLLCMATLCGALGGVFITPAVLAQETAAVLPDAGDGIALTLGAERRLGDRIARELYRDPDYIDDPVILEYVQSIWTSLRTTARIRGEIPPSLEAAFAWEVLMGRDRSVNAFALPGGYFGLHLGLVAVVANRDELASVMAHELSHVSQRHIARSMAQQSAQAPWLMGAMILGVLAASKDVHAANALITGGQAGAIQTQLNFSRSMEREADRIGFGVMSQAGYDPQGFADMFEKLQQSSRLNDSGGFPYLRSHPLTTERIADMQGRVFAKAADGPTSAAPSAAPPTHRASKAPMTLQHAMIAARAYLLSHTAVTDWQRWAYMPATELSQLLRTNPAGAWYSKALAALLLRDFAEAQNSLQRLAPVVAKDPAAARLARLLETELAMAQQKPAQAAAALQSVNDMGRAAVLMRAKVQTANGQASAAAQDLQTWLADHPRDASAWEQLAAAYNAQNRSVAAIRAQAEASVAHLEYEAALDRLKAAELLVRQSAAVDNIEASIVDTRIREVSQLFKEQTQER